MFLKESGFGNISALYWFLLAKEWWSGLGVVGGVHGVVGCYSVGKNVNVSRETFAILLVFGGLTGRMRGVFAEN